MHSDWPLTWRRGSGEPSPPTSRSCPARRSVQGGYRNAAKAGLRYTRYSARAWGGCASLPTPAARRRTRGVTPRVVSPDRHGCFLGAGGGTISGSVWPIICNSVEWRIESTAGLPVLGRFAVAADENLNPLRFWVWYTSPVIFLSVASRSACVTPALALLGVT